MPNRVRGPTPQAFSRPVTVPAGASHAHHFASDSKVRRRLDHASGRLGPSPRPLAGGARSAQTGHLALRARGLKDALVRNVLQISAALFLVGCVGWCWIIYQQFRAPSPSAVAAYALTAAIGADSALGKPDMPGAGTPQDDRRQPASQPAANFSGETAAAIVAGEWSRFESFQIAGRGRLLARESAQDVTPPVQLASLESDIPQVAPIHAPTQAIPSHVRPRIGATTALVDFETAPFPYHGMIADTNRPFLNAGEEGHRGHVNFRGHVFWESPTFSDDRVLLHIPPGFDPTRPGVIVVFFHGHGANLARDVRDRQQVPTQITASGANAVLVAPQFAVNAADSSAGKFWEPNGFKRFLDEAAVKLARLYGDPRRTAAFARMPIVIVAYSGGFGPTLAVLQHGGVRSRVRGIVLLDALYAGIDRFADWIAANRSTFFVSAFTPHTAHHNADLESLLRERSVPFGSELRRRHLQGMVAFLPTGDVSHRDFVTHAWIDSPIKDILMRMDVADTRMETAARGQ